MGILFYVKYFIRIISLTCFILFILLLIVLGYLCYGEPEPAKKIEFGITFSSYFAEQLGLDWKRAYLGILDGLEVKKLRLIAYWPQIEPGLGKYYFEDLDWQIEEAKKRDAEVILAIGRRLPRWPECHVPQWANELSEKEQQERILKMLKELVGHYRDEEIITTWQIENEPFLEGFGECPKLDKSFLEEEIKLVQSLDYRFRPIMITVSGELSTWVEPSFYADVIGTSLYRDIYNKWLGHFRYPIPPAFYHNRAEIIKGITGLDKMIIIELQGEPWGSKQIYDTPVREQLRLMSVKKFNNVIDYTRRTGFDEVYFWGAEWWYYLKINYTDDIWVQAKKLWQD